MTLKEQLLDLITKYPNFTIKCLSSDKRADNIKYAYTIEHLSISYADETIFIFYYK